MCLSAFLLKIIQSCHKFRDFLMNDYCCSNIVLLGCRNSSSLWPCTFSCPLPGCESPARIIPSCPGPFCMAVLGQVTSCLIPLICDPSASATGRDLGSQMIWSTWEELTSTRSQKASQQPRSRHKTQYSQLPAPQQDTSTCTLSHPPGQGLAHRVHCTEHTRTLPQTIWTRFVFSLRFM